MSSVSDPELRRADTPDGQSQEDSDDIGPESVSLSTDHDGSAGGPKRSEVLRHVFNRPSRLNIASARRASSRITKLDQRRNAPLSIQPTRRRVAFQKVLTSIFGSAPVRVTPYSGQQRAHSSISNITSRSGSILHESVHSLDLIGPGAFNFSGPDLGSQCSSPVGNLTPQFTSQSDVAHNGSGSFVSERRKSEEVQRRAHSESISSASFVLEPSFEYGLTGSMSDVLLRIHTPSNESDSLIPEHIDEHGHPTEVVLQANNDDAAERSSTMACQLPLPLVALILPYVNSCAMKAMRLTCRSWYELLNGIAPPNLPHSYDLPNEILQEIYNHLHPKDFNAARHTCRVWMSASLDRALLTSMLKRGGWWTNRRTLTSDLDEWALSRLLSRECSLSSWWTGNGLEGAVHEHQSNTPLVKAAGTDFADLASGYAGPQGRHGGGLIFTTSVCGRFLLVAEGGMIYIYELQGCGIKPLTSVICPRRVLAMSMDATARRFAIAALLEGRMGLVCDLHVAHIPRDECASASYDVGGTSHIAVETNEVRTSVFTSRLPDPQSRAPRDESAFNTIDVQTQNEGITLRGTDDAGAFARNWINQEWNLKLQGAPTVATSRVQATRAPLPQTDNYDQTQGVPIETGSRSVYRHLCCEDDPPRSVSICPQRRCVAFGCLAGIELHWVDALTGQDLNRWFPLTAPSDFLYFLPARPGFDSAKKLRLISSAAHPSERPSIGRKFSSSRSPYHELWRSSTANCDHYRAVPLSDGHHVLFTEPQENKLFLGSDAPVGGPTKLLRKIVFEPPKPDDIPRLYVAASDLSCGARVAAVFGDTVALYSVPDQMFELSRIEQRAESWELYSDSRFTENSRSEDHWLNWCERERPTSTHLMSRDPIWPVTLRGQIIGSLDGIVELAITTEPDITIWAFALDGQSITWQLPCLAEPVTIVERAVGRDGTVHDLYTLDADDCVVMTDASAEAEVDTERSVGFDGHSSVLSPRRLPHALRIDQDEFIESLDISTCGAWYDAEGNVFMYDADTGEAVI